MSERLTILDRANEVVDEVIVDLTFVEGCLVVHVLDQLSERALQMIEKCMPQAEITKVAEQIDDWITFGNGSVRSLHSFGTGKDEEKEWEVDQAYKQKEREDQFKRINEQRHRKNDIRDDYEL